MCLETLGIGLPTANQVTGLSGFSDGMCGLVEGRKAVELRCFGVGWFWDGGRMLGFFVLFWGGIEFFVSFWGCLFCLGVVWFCLPLIHL